MAPSTLASASKSLSIALAQLLPAEVLFDIIEHLDEPLDLYHASLVSRTWRNAATDPRLWEKHYLRHYKPLLHGEKGDDQERELYQYREARRRAGMIAWLKQTSTLPPGDFQSLPHFLQNNTIATTARTTTLPDFHLLFVKRINADEIVMQELRSLINETSGTLAGLVRFIDKHGDAARPLLAALCATQALSPSNLEHFVPPHDENGAPWPRAREIYTYFWRGTMEPHSSYCLALQHVAAKALGHLQRREAIKALDILLESKASLKAVGVRNVFVKDSEAVEEVMIGMASFQSGDSSAIRECLDLLALFVFADLQAEDNAAAREGKPYDLAPHPMTMPAGSTRHRLARIVASLRGLGYGMASPPDINTAFVNTVLFDPAQRSTTCWTLATIVSAVARRLGIAASVSNAPTPLTLVIATEDTDEPAGWKGGARTGEWEHFFVDAAHDHQHRFFSKDSQCIYETEDVARYVLEQGHATVNDPLAIILGPASSYTFLQRMASEIMLLAENQKTSIGRDRGKEDASSQGSLLACSALDHLRLYLEGRVDSAPPPLLLPTAPCFEAAHIHLRRVSAARLLEDAKYCAQWMERIVAEHRQEQDVRKKIIAKTSTSLARKIGTATISGMYGCDYQLLLELEKRREDKDVAQGLNEATTTEDQNSRPSNSYRTFIDRLLQEDAQKGKGLGCSGGADQERRKARPHTSLPRHLIDRAANPAVKYGIGTVFRHRRRGWLGVVVGWDTVCRADNEWIQSMRKDSRPGGGRNQPFYKVISEHDRISYQAQCDIQPIKVAAGSSREEAVAVLQKIATIFETRGWGKAFNTLRVEPWDDEKGTERVVEVSEGTAMKAKRTAEKGRSDGPEKSEEEVGGRAKGQVYLVPNAWLREAWPYD